MATLTENIDATQKVILVSGSAPDQGHFRIRIDDELMDVEGFDRKQLRGGYRDPGVDRTRWIVTRGVGGTTAATHSAGDTLKAAVSALLSADDLTPPLPFAGEGGAVEQVVYSQTVTLTDANIKALPTTPFELLPEPAAGQRLFIVGGTVTIDVRAGVYTNFGATTKFRLVLGGVWNQDAILFFKDQLEDNSAVFVNDFRPNADFTYVDEVLLGGGFTATTPNGVAGNFTGGNAANTIKITTLYSVADL